MFIFEALVQTRINVLNLAEKFNTSELNLIPKGHNNNIIWHIGHMMASQQILCYSRSGAEMRVSNELIEKYRKGTSPIGWKEEVPLQELSLLFMETANVFYDDFKAGKLSNYERYATASGVVLENIDNALAYSYGHENLHFGNIATLAKIVR